MSFNAVDTRMSQRIRPMFFSILLILLPVISSSVIELDESFVDQFNEGTWVVNFYAPWCGYCRRLAPIYEEFSSSLSTLLPSVKVARLDASNFNTVGRKFDVQGFPTIKYFENGKVFTYDGERTVYGLLSFVLRVNGPAVKVLKTEEELLKCIRFFGTTPYFVLATYGQSKFKDVFYAAAEHFRTFSWFLHVPPDLISRHLPPSAPSTIADVMVFKDNETIPYLDGPDLISLSTWMVLERHPGFPYFTFTDLWEFGSSEWEASSILMHINPDSQSFSQRSLVLFVVNSYSSVTESTNTFTDSGRLIAKNQRETFKSIYQFGWTDAVAMLSDVAMIDVVPPGIIVFDPTNQRVYLYSDWSETFSFDEDALVSFLSSVKRGEVQPRGGKGFFTKLRRLFRKLMSEFTNFAANHPMIALLITALPTMVISGLFYLCCCLDDHYASNDSSRWVVSGDQRVLAKHTRKQYAVTGEFGPIDSEDMVMARHQEYENSKKNR